jgi:tetratricopeptide (TPR) repeat protein
MYMRFVSILIFGLAISCLAQTAGRNNAPPRSDDQRQSQAGDSSSKDSKIDLSPPKGDDVIHREDDPPDNSDVMEAKPWNPHKAAKDIEVGDYYAKRKNYRGAISRYREALEYKPKDAEATFKLAKALEASKVDDEALQRYMEYLKILPQGEFAKEAQEAVGRLKAAHKAPDPS